jgi:hypothetical protein
MCDSVPYTLSASHVSPYQPTTWLIVRIVALFRALCQVSFLFFYYRYSDITFEILLSGTVRQKITTTYVTRQRIKVSRRNKTKESSWDRTRFSRKQCRFKHGLPVYCNRTTAYFTQDSTGLSAGLVPWNRLWVPPAIRIDLPIKVFCHLTM